MFHVFVTFEQGAFVRRVGEWVKVKGRPGGVWRGRRKSTQIDLNRRNSM
jgi:hypothetical protein